MHKFTRVIIFLLINIPLLNAQIITNKDVVKNIKSLKVNLDKKMESQYSELNGKLNDLHDYIVQLSNAESGGAEALVIDEEIKKISSSLAELKNNNNAIYSNLNSMEEKLDGFFEKPSNSLDVEEKNPDSETETGKVEEDFSQSAWFRIDGDRDGVYFWYGGSTNIGSLSLAHEIIYFPGSNSFEAEIGPYFSFADGAFDVLPMIGLYMDLSSGETSYILPQLYFYSTTSNLYLELWNMYYLGSSSVTKNEQLYYGRYIAKFNLSERITAGPQVEMMVDLSDDVDERVLSLAVGGVIGLPYGNGNSLDIFLGADTKSESNKMVARFTFIHQL